MSTRTIAIAPVFKTVTVAASQAHCFTVFTAGVDRWWPKTHGIGSTPPVKTAIEPRQGGRWYSVHEDGGETVNGHVLAWEPHDRVVFSWEINANWKPDTTVASEIEVRFIAEAPNRTRVEVEHRKFEVLGAEGGAKMRKDVDGGWPGLMDLFAKEAERSA